MARLNALGLMQADGVTPLSLAELYAAVIENVSKTAVSVAFKNKNQSGNVAAGTVEYKRFADSAAVAYGTARAAGKGAILKIAPVVVTLNVDREIIEEIEEKDILTSGIPNMINRQVLAHAKAFKRDIDTAFWKEAYATGVKATIAGVTTAEQVEELILAVEDVSNQYVDGVERDMLGLCFTTKMHSKLRLEIDELPANSIELAQGAIGAYHGVPVWVSNHLPKVALQKVDAICMFMGSVAQPLNVTKQYADEKIPLSNAHAIELFYSYGTEATMPDLIAYIGDLFVA